MRIAFWKRQETAQNAPVEPDPGVVDRLTAAVEALAQQLDQLRLRQGEVERQWSEIMDKLNRWFAREAARRRKDTAEALDQLSGEAAAVGPQLHTASGVSKAELRRLASEKVFKRRGATG